MSHDALLMLKKPRILQVGEPAIFGVPARGGRVKSGATLEVGAELEGRLIGDMPTAMIKIDYRNNAHLLKH